MINTFRALLASLFLGHVRASYQSNCADNLVKSGYANE